MLDGSSKKSSVNEPLIPKKGSWETISKELFDKCLTWPDGPVHSNRNVSIYAERFAELVRSLSYFELTAFEAKDVRDFLNFYSALVEVIARGPGKPNGFHLRSLKPQQLFEEFGKTAKRLIEIIDETLESIALESENAFENHEKEQDKDILKNKARTKSRISLDGEISDLLSQLDEIALGKSTRKGSSKFHATERSTNGGFAKPEIPIERVPLDRAV